MGWIGVTRVRDTDKDVIAAVWSRTWPWDGEERYSIGWTDGLGGEFCALGRVEVVV